MKIIVCAKQVPDTNEVRIDPVKGTLIRDGVPSILNPDDATALEAALTLREQEGGQRVRSLDGAAAGVLYAARMPRHGR